MAYIFCFCESRLMCNHFFDHTVCRFRWWLIGHFWFVTNVECQSSSSTAKYGATHEPNCHIYVDIPVGIPDSHVRLSFRSWILFIRQRQHKHCQVSGKCHRLHKHFWLVYPKAFVMNTKVVCNWSVQVTVAAYAFRFCAELLKHLDNVGLDSQTIELVCSLSFFVFLSTEQVCSLHLVVVWPNRRFFCCRWWFQLVCDKLYILWASSADLCLLARMWCGVTTIDFSSWLARSWPQQTKYTGVCCHLL